MIFADRQEAGQLLAAKLAARNFKKPVVLALPRGGVPVGFEIASALSAPLNLVLVRKIGAPQQEELAIGAVADGEHPELVTDSRLIAALAVSSDYLEEMKAAALKEIERRRRVYLAGRTQADLLACTAILVDDGLATGATMRAALRATRHRRPARLVLAIPVAPPDTLERLKEEADETVCLHVAADFYGVGQFYRDFRQLTDMEVTRLLDLAQSRAAPSST